jgi:hypothetical protein
MHASMKNVLLKSGYEDAHQLFLLSGTEPYDSETSY